LCAFELVNAMLFKVRGVPGTWCILSFSLIYFDQYSRNINFANCDLIFFLRCCIQPIVTNGLKEVLEGQTIREIYMQLTMTSLVG